MIVLVTGSSGHLGEAIMRTFRQQPKQEQKGQEEQKQTAEEEEEDKIEAIGVDVLKGEYTDFIGSVSDAEFLKKTVFGCDQVTKSKRGIVGIINTAVLHKPHILRFSGSDFVNVNILGVTNLFECFREYLDKKKTSQSKQKKEEEEEGEEKTFFIQTSTTSTYGDSLISQKEVTWISEETIPSPKNIYGVTKRSAEDLCELFAKQGLVRYVFVLQASRFFAEADDEPERRKKFASNDHQHFVELFHRRVELQDLVDVHLLAMKKALFSKEKEETKEEKKHQRRGAFARYLCSTPSPFLQQDLKSLSSFSSEKIEQVVALRVGQDLFAKFRERFPSWNFPDDVIDRVYDSSKAVKELGWKCNYTPQLVMQRLLDENKSEKEFEEETFSCWKSPLAKIIGRKDYFRKD